MSISRLAVVALIASVAAAASVSVVSTDKYGKVVKFKDSPVSYYVPSEPLSSMNTPGCIGPPRLVAATSIRAPRSPITKVFLEGQLEFFKSVDDVWNEKYMDTLFVAYDGPATGYFDDEAKVWLRKQKFARIYLAKTIQPPSTKNLKPVLAEVEDAPPGGAYFISASTSSSPSSRDLNIYEPYRLYEDEYEAFLFGAIPNPSGKGWVATNITLPSSKNQKKVQYIPVPSRLSVMSGTPKHLSGTRFGLKDLYDVEGLPTGAGSLAYAKVNPIPSTTAPSVQKLLSHGATFIGKTRTSQFAHGAQPWEFVDVPYSWNPRGDGHLTASGSSSGSACAIAGYDWVDFTIGSDTRGSVRKPAALVGTYGLRPTHGSMDLTGVVPLSEEMDTAGFFARDPRIFHEVQRLWYADTPLISRRQTIRFPPKLYYPTEHFPVKNPDAQDLFDEFVNTLKEHLNVEKVPLNFSAVLEPYLPHGFPTFQRMSNKLAEYRSWQSVGKPLVDQFFSLYGENPIFDPVPQTMFDRALNISTDEFQEAIEAKHQFRDALDEHIFKADVKSCSDSLFIYDFGTGGLPSYRDQELNKHEGATQLPLILTGGIDGLPAKPSDFFNILASMGELPEVTLPVGQVEYHSRVSGKWEKLPVAVQLVTRKGCDGMLMELVKKLGEKGLIKPVKAGQDAF